MLLPPSYLGPESSSSGPLPPVASSQPSRTGKYKNLAIIGAIISVLGYVLMILYWNGHTNWFEALYPVSTGFGASFVFQSNFIALTAAVAKEEVAMATGSLVSLLVLL